ncbi:MULTISPECIES: class I SAM-dependent methyltransferase [Achromobacter]|uniref:SAM-dependent methyltransferase n=1 Tax=Achromobacter piechaudii TaxID=72556 RepID=A0A6S7ESJ8_9BURK|nr:MULTISPECIES: class I SAM-dependent methyltransferase [Achromobacter]MPS79494.1 methyltransferase domain-containing protein [Achromobacter sp.]CAB3920909.1 hypothetical protein LMG1861_05399 [Achromobacter piechaudii]
MICRHCRSTLEHSLVDLGAAPPSNAYLSANQLSQSEIAYPLRVRVCSECWLVQTEDYTSADALFTPEYAYFSSTSSSWLKHAADYTSMITKRLNLNRNSFVIEVASNDGYLLKNFVAANIPCLGVEPTVSTANAALALNIPVVQKFFGSDLASKLCHDGQTADLIIGNNVYAHVPDINDFTSGLAQALKPGGTITLEFPHLLNLLDHTQFDTIYHEHFSYLSLYTVGRIFAVHGLRVTDVETLLTHGGSLRIYGCHAQDPRLDGPAVAAILAAEEKAGLRTHTPYAAFQNGVNRIKDALVSFLIDQKRAGKCVAAYGAAAKGNTLLNYAGIKSDLLSFVCDAAPYKQGKYLPGSRIPVLAPDALRAEKPDFVVILPWNIAGEVMNQVGYIREWGGRFVTAVPQLEIL